MIKRARPILALLLFLLILGGCQAKSYLLEPEISYLPTASFVQQKPSAFSPLNPEEYRQDWGKELVIANTFASETDYYRAITSYKRALVLAPTKLQARRLQMHYGILLSYYFGGKYAEAAETFEASPLRDVSEDFPPFEDMLTILYDIYQRIGDPVKSESILKIIETKNEGKASELQLSEAIRDAKLGCVLHMTRQNPPLACFLDTYFLNAKSVRTAQMLNAVLPGAGYLYMGQKQTALTSFCINTLFIAAAYYFFDHGNVAAGIITTSLEMGWYFGGINGAGLVAKEYNDRLYETLGKETMLQHCLFPVLMLKYTF